MKKLFIIVAMVVLVAALILGGCAQPTPPAPSPIPTPAPTPAPAPEVINMKFSSPLPPPSTAVPRTVQLQGQMELLAEKIAAETNGRVKITVYHAGSLLKTEDSFEGVIGGVAGLAWTQFRHHPRLADLLSVFELPGLGWQDPVVVCRVIEEVIAKYPQLREELKGVKPLVWYQHEANSLHINRDVVMRTPADLRGMKVGCGAAEFAFFEAWGAVPVGMGGPDLYMNLNKGIIDVVSTMWGGVRAFKINEITKSHTEHVGLPPMISTVLISQKLWDSLPPDVQKVFNDNKEWWAKTWCETVLAGGKIAKDEAVKLGHPVYKPTPAELKLWLQPLEPLTEKWIAKREAKGMPARAIVDDVKRLISKYQ